MMQMSIGRSSSDYLRTGPYNAGTESAQLGVRTMGDDMGDEFAFPKHKEALNKWLNTR